MITASELSWTLHGTSPGLTVRSRCTRSDARGPWDQSSLGGDEVRRVSATAVALILPIAFACGPAAATPQDTPRSQVARVLPAQGGPVDICDYTDRRPNLQRGSSGAAVRQAQCYLNQAIATDLDEDGDFGQETRRAVRYFQRCAEIVADGRIGAQTWSFLSFWANDPGAPFC
ncbi:peptidoglycan-binding protein [Streptomyces sp. NPDC059720]|uniref:peptidoglycan-binding domain-containing protein n=1 Tax=Streptomyces sp. NPDC059720 TaxID=3346924 RepID=UPI0036B88F1B